MKINWLLSLVLKGTFIMLVSGTALWFFGDPITLKGYFLAAWLTVSALFVIGLVVAILSFWDYLFGCCGEPNYVYRPHKKQILVKYSTTQFQIERNGTKIWVGMVSHMPFRIRKITLRETNLQLASWLKKDHFTALDGDNLFVTEDGQKLHLSRQTLGIKIWWEEDEPWKIVK